MSSSISPNIQQELSDKGFIFLPSEHSHTWLTHYGLKNWEEFARTWNDLGIDLYMADGGRYRRRRYGTFSLSQGTITHKKHQPHYQSRDYNLLNGGVERWFSPLTDETRTHPVLTAILHAASDIADTLTSSTHSPLSWHAEVHQFRIETAPDLKGKPTPEGMHQDGVDWVFVFMINRENIREGVTTIHALDQKTSLGSFTLASPLDTAIVDDHRVFHGVTSVEPEDITHPAYRDVLVVTLRYE